MSLSNNEDRSHSILETSLTELAFIFFFILCIFSSWKISDSDEKLDEQEVISNELHDKISLLTDELSEISKYEIIAEKYNAEDLFIELSKGRIAEANLNIAKEKQKKLENELEKYSALVDVQSKKDVEEIAKKILEFEKIQKIFNDNFDENGNGIYENIVYLKQSLNKSNAQFSELMKDSAIKIKKLEEVKDKFSALSDVKSKEDVQRIALNIQEFEKIQEILTDSSYGTNKNISEQVRLLHSSVNDIKGQNTNLRNKLGALENGLDHPPCWANSVTGNIEYVFDVIINERDLVVRKGWPESRNEQAIRNNNITRIIGKYNKKELLWNSTEYLFNESKNMKCRHFVRVYDHSDSKSSFKYYLSAIENHFYKYLSTSSYE